MNGLSLSIHYSYVRNTEGMARIQEDVIVLQQGYSQNRRGLLRDAEGLVNSFAKDCGNAGGLPGGGGENDSPGFLLPGVFQIGKEITEFLAPLHSERHEPVPSLPEPADKRESQPFRIKNQDSIGLSEHQVCRAVEDLNPESDICKRIFPCIPD